MQAAGRRLSAAKRGTNGSGGGSDRLVARVCDPFWVEVRWELTRDIIRRAEAALGIDWREAVPVIRVFEVSTSETGQSSSARLFDIEIHGGVDHWYVPVDDPPRQFKFQIGYRTAGGKFFVLAKSNKVRTPRPGAPDGKHATNGSSASPWPRRTRHDASSPFHLKEVIDTRPVTLAEPRDGQGPAPRRNGRRNGSALEFQLDAELVVFGVTHPDAELSLLGETVRTGPDGSFSLRFTLPDGRQVLPVVSVSQDGCESRTIVLAVDRNTRVMEPQSLDEPWL